MSLPDLLDAEAFQELQRSRAVRAGSLLLCASCGGARHGSELKLAGNRDKESRNCSIL